MLIVSNQHLEGICLRVYRSPSPHLKPTHYIYWEGFLVQKLCPFHCLLSLDSLIIIIPCVIKNGEQFIENLSFTAYIALPD